MIDYDSTLDAEDNRLRIESNVRQILNRAEQMAGRYRSLSEQFAALRPSERVAHASLLMIVVGTMMAFISAFNIVFKFSELVACALVLGGALLFAVGVSAEAIVRIRLMSEDGREMTEAVKAAMQARNTI